ncbi:MAG: acetyl ornithine aminotransferase family protein [Bdellovibrionales bacterium]|nr:acetyl ornithine aminotransferase family protein [Bdellovibrionales bacterium]
MAQQLNPEIKTALPGPKAKAIIDLDRKYSSPSYIKEYPLVMERGEGPWVYDVDGNRFLDMMAGIAVTSTGHSHPKVVQAIKDAADKFLHICPTDFYYDSFAKLCEKLAGYVPKMGPKKIFLTNSGTEAVEGAIKLARHHTKRPYIIAFKGAFHGRTMGAISLNSSKVTQRAFFGPLMPNVLHIPYAYPYRCAYKNEASFCEKSCTCATALETDWFPSHLDPKEVAAIFVEPILGEGGYVMPPKKFLQDLRAICDKHGIVLVFDEVQSGIGRTGKMFACEVYDVAPDVILSAKGIASGMPIGAIIAKESIMTWPRASHGSTYAGNPVCCAAAIATLEIVEPMMGHVTKMGEVLMSGLRDLQKKHKVLGDVRGVGLMVGAEFVHPATKAPAADYVGDLEQLAFTKGMLLLSCGKSTIRFAPPLVINEHEIKTALKLLDECMTELNQKHGAKLGL